MNQNRRKIIIVLLLIVTAGLSIAVAVVGYRLTRPTSTEETQAASGRTCCETGGQPTICDSCRIGIETKNYDGNDSVDACGGVGTSVCVECDSSKPISLPCSTGDECTKVDGGWSSWSTCKSNCKQTRSCNNPSPSCGGASCSGDSSKNCTGGACVVCGDGTKSTTEECDNKANPTGCAAGSTCNDSCKCIADPACGDGTKNGAEECDNKANPTGCAAGSTCNDSCKCIVNVSCGDGIKSGSETCDFNANPTGCASGSICTTNCQCLATGCGEACTTTLNCPANHTCSNNVCILSSCVGRSDCTNNGCSLPLPVTGFLDHENNRNLLLSVFIVVIGLLMLKFNVFSIGMNLYHSAVSSLQKVKFVVEEAKAESHEKKLNERKKKYEEKVEKRIKD